MLLSILLQIAQDSSQVAANMPAVNAEDSLSLMDLLAKGGLLMIPIILLSLVSTYILFERYMAIKKLGKSQENLKESVFNILKQGDINGARNICKSNPGAVSAVLEKGISRIGKPVREIESAMESAGKIELSKMEKGLAVLGIIAGIAPMFGFVGTISGVIKIFYNISLTDNISIGAISGGLYEKMITSAAGLIVGIFSFVGYHILQIMIDRSASRMEESAAKLIDLIQEPEA